MVEAVRGGKSQRQVARQFNVPLSTVQHWVARAGRQRLDRVEWCDRSRARKSVDRTPAEVEDRVLELRRQLREESPLGECGARAIRDGLLAESPTAPAIRTIGRILLRRGVLDGVRRVRRTPPPRGWYLPDVADGSAELDSFDVVSGLAFEGGHEIEVLNGVSLHGGLVMARPVDTVTAVFTVEALLDHWRTFGLPAYAQFDNDTRFQGAHQHRDSLGRVVRVCLGLSVVPVFAPPRETGFQAAIERFNGLWQEKVWARFRHPSPDALRERSGRYVDAYRQRHRVRQDAAPARRPFPTACSVDLNRPLSGRVIFLRRTDEKGEAQLLGHAFAVSASWPHRLVRAEVDLDGNEVRFFALRRRAPLEQPLLATSRYTFPRRRFKDRRPATACR